LTNVALPIVGFNIPIFIVLRLSTPHLSVLAISVLWLWWWWRS